MLTRRNALYLLGASPLIGCEHAGEGSRSSGPIAEEGFVAAGGIEQWTSIRGASVRNPAILFLHGGPCETQSPFLSVFAPWEARYTVAQWDQRGAGRTFGRNGPSTPNITLEQISRDAVTISEHILNRLGQRKLILVGHSWGAMVGLSIVRLRPDLFHVFVATGLPVSGHEIVEGMRLSAVERAQAAGDNQAVSELNELRMNEVTDMSQLNVLFRWSAPFPDIDRRYLAARGAALGTAASPASAAAADFYSANPICLPQLLPFVLGFDARASRDNLSVPFFVVQGRDDIRTPPEAARAYVDDVKAPAKGYSEIDGGHYACFTNPTGFLGALDSVVDGLGII